MFDGVGSIPVPNPPLELENSEKIWNGLFRDGSGNGRLRTETLENFSKFRKKSGILAPLKPPLSWTLGKATNNERLTGSARYASSITHTRASNKLYAWILFVKPLPDIFKLASIVSSLVPFGVVIMRESPHYSGGKRYHKRKCFPEIGSKNIEIHQQRAIPIN